MKKRLGSIAKRFIVYKSQDRNLINDPVFFSPPKINQGFSLRYVYLS